MAERRVEQLAQWVAQRRLAELVAQLVKGLVRTTGRFDRGKRPLL
jgi:hypothetical protein